MRLPVALQPFGAYPRYYLDTLSLKKLQVSPPDRIFGTHRQQPSLGDAARHARRGSTWIASPAKSWCNRP